MHIKVSGTTTVREIMSFFYNIKRKIHYTINPCGAFEIDINNYIEDKYSEIILTIDDKSQEQIEQIIDLHLTNFLINTIKEIFFLFKWIILTSLLVIFYKNEYTILLLISSYIYTIVYAIIKGLKSIYKNIFLFKRFFRYLYIYKDLKYSIEEVLKVYIFDRLYSSIKEYAKEEIYKKLSEELDSGSMFKSLKQNIKNTILKNCFEEKADEFASYFTTESLDYVVYNVWFVLRNILLKKLIFTVSFVLTYYLLIRYILLPLFIENISGLSYIDVLIYPLTFLKQQLNI